MKSKILIAFFSIVVLITFSNFQQAQTMVGNSKATNGPNSGSDYSPPATSSTHYVNGVGAGANDAGNGGQGNVAWFKCVVHVWWEQRLYKCRSDNKI